MSIFRYPMRKSIAHGFEKTWISINAHLMGNTLPCKLHLKVALCITTIKTVYSVVLMAVAHAHYNFAVVDVGGYEKQSDGNVLANSAFGQKLTNRNLLLPPPEPIIGTRANLVLYSFLMTSPSNAETIVLGADKFLRRQVPSGDWRPGGAGSMLRSMCRQR